jgi:hypothetical protein
MAEDQDAPKTGETDENGAQGRTIENVQSEFNRKMTKLADENSKLSQQLSDLAGMVQQAVQPRQQANSSQSDDDLLADLAYKDPKAYALKISDRAEQRAMRMVDERLNANNQTNNTLSQLGLEYPELNDANSELTLKAVELYKRLSNEDRKSPLAYKAAVRDAAADLGVLPKNKRKATSETPEINSGNSSTAAANSRQGQSKNVDAKTLAFAKLMGLDTSKKEVVERLKLRSQRTKWNKFE